MKKIIIILSVAACISAAFFTMTVTSDTKPGNGFVLGLVEALAQNENGGGGNCVVNCPNGNELRCFTVPCSAGDNYVECNGSKTYC